MGKKTKQNNSSKFKASKNVPITTSAVAIEVQNENPKSAIENESLLAQPPQATKEENFGDDQPKIEKLLIADGSFKQGDVIFKSIPYACVVSDEFVEKVCHNCFETEETLFKCAGCKFVYYCNKECQKSDWRAHHKLECQSLAGFKVYLDDGSIRTEETRLLARLIRRYEGELARGERYTEVVFDKARDFDCLVSHLEEVKSSEEIFKRFLAWANLLDVYLKPKGTGLSQDQIFDIMGKQAMNSCLIYDDEACTIGIGLYLGHSVLDHSCQPNSVVSFKGVEISLRAIDYIVNASELNVFISYTDLFQNRHERKTYLKDVYYFNCACTKCLDDEFDLQCTLPLTYMPDNLLSNDFRSMNSEQLDATFNRCSKFFSQNPSDSNNSYFVRTLIDYFDVLREMELWEEALKYGELLLVKYEFYRVSYQSAYGLLLTKLGEIHKQVENFGQAKSVLGRALEVVAITHGPESNLYLNITESVKDCEELMTTVAQ